MATARRNKRTGAWEVRCYAGIDRATGKKRNLSRTLPPDASGDEVAAAKADLDRIAAFCRSGGVSWTVGGLLRYDLERLPALGLSPTTVDGYASYLRCYIEPYVGSMPVADARPYVFSSLLRRIATRGGKDGNPVSPATARKVLAWLSGAFGRLASEGVIAQSPVAGVKPPKQAPPESMALSADEVRRLSAWLEANEGDPCADAISLCLDTGLRRSELAGLRVGDYNRAFGQIKVARVLVETRGGVVEKEPKSGTSKRWVPVPGTAGERLSRHIESQRGRLAGNGVAQGADTPMFATDGGAAVRPSDLTAAFRAAADAAGLPKRHHLHSLRHTYATYLLSTGTSFKEAQELLGHASATTTLNVYGHVVPGRKSEAADAYIRWREGKQE